MEEIPQSKPGEWLADQQRRGEGIRLDPDVMMSSIEKLVEERGPADAVTNVLERLEKNPGDAVARQEADALVKKFGHLAEDLAVLKTKVQH